jgi:hypothetical protein
MASHFDYLLVRQRQAELAREAERARVTRAGEPLAGAPRRGRLAGVLRLVRSEQRELALAPRSDERIPVAAGCLEVE